MESGQIELSKREAELQRGLEDLRKRAAALDAREAASEGDWQVERAGREAVLTAREEEVRREGMRVEEMAAESAREVNALNARAVAVDQQARALTSRSEAVDKRNIEIDRKDAEVSARMAILEDRQAEVRERAAHTHTHTKPAASSSTRTPSPPLYTTHHSSSHYSHTGDDE